jgi:hypothetical protein
MAGLEALKQELVPARLQKLHDRLDALNNDIATRGMIVLTTSS